MLYLFLILFLSIIVTVCFSLIVIFSVKKNSRFGINFEIPNCPKCGQKLPSVRKPKSAQQALWGGWTCSACGCEIDKWGVEILNPKNQDTQKQIQEKKENFIEYFDKKGKTPVERVFEDDTG